jgi:peptidoglycan/xylan/chitin deacetylase (PgdA/CDA1 family)
MTTSSLHGKGPWPDGRRAAISVTFDNLGEAAELEMGMHEDGAELGEHHSVTNSLPIVLEELSGAGLEATFFVEGINAELYPGSLARIAEAGHEVAFHAWRHEEWSALGPDEEAANLDRGLKAMDAIGLRPRGFRPPGGRIGEHTLALLADRGLAHCSPAGADAGLDATVAVLPFAWPDVDAFHILPTFEALREHHGGSGEAGGPEAVRDTLCASIDRVVAEGGHLALVLHTWLIEAEREQVTDVLARVAKASESGEAWVARCDAVADRMTAHADDFAADPQLDETSWMSPG